MADDLFEIKVRDKDGKVKEFKGLTRSQLEDAIGDAKSGKYDLLDKSGKPYPYYKKEDTGINVIPRLDTLLPKVDPAVMRDPELSPIEQGKRAFIRMGVGAAINPTSPANAIFSALLNGAIGPDPKNLSDAGTQVAAGNIGGKVANIAAGAGALQTIPRQMAAQGAIGAGTQYGEGALQSYLDSLFGGKDHPDPKLPNLRDPKTLMSMIGAGGLGAVAGGAGQWANTRTSPAVESAKMAESMTGNPTQPYDLKDLAVKYQNEGPNAQTSVGVLRDQMLKKEEELRKNLLVEKTNKSASKFEQVKQKESFDESALRNKEDIGKDKVDMMLMRGEISPERTAAFKSINSSQEQLDGVSKQLADYEKTFANNKASSRNPQQQAIIDKALNDLRAQKTDLEGKINSTKAYMNQYSEAMKEKAIDITLQSHDVRQYGDYKYTNPSNKAEARTKMSEARQQEILSDIQIKNDQDKLARGGTPFSYNTASILKSGKNSEEVVRNLLQRDPAEIRSFMTETGSKVKNMRESVIGEVLRGSWDEKSKSFGNFDKLYGMQGTSGNLTPRLEAVLGNRDQAEKAVEAINLMNQGLEKSKMLDKSKQGLANIAGLTAAINGIKAVTGHGMTHSALLGGELGSYTLMSLPRLMESVVTDKRKFDAFKAWSETGFAADALRKGNPLFNSIMDMGDHFTYDDKGNPKLDTSH